MTTKNLVPRANNEGEIGIASRKWAKANFTTGNFDKINTNELKNSSNGELLVAGDNVTITSNTVSGTYTIASSGGGGGGGLQAINDLSDVVVENPASEQILVYSSASPTVLKNVAISGDAIISAGGALTIKDDAITYEKIQNITATDIILGRSTAGAGIIEEIACTAAGRELLNDADVGAQRTTLELGSGNTPQFTGIDLGHATDTTITRLGAGDINIEGKRIYRAGGIDIPVTDGGTGASTAVVARTNLGVAIGSDVQAFDAQLADISGLAVADGNFIVGNSSNFIVESGETARTSIGLGAGNSPTFTSLTLSGQTGVLNLSNKKIINLADPTDSKDAVTKLYADTIASGLSPKGHVKLATTVSGTLATDFKNNETIDGIALATGNRILIKDQAEPKDNGVYTVNAAGPPTRATDMDIADTISGVFVFVESGTENANKGFVCTSADNSDIVGTHDLDWATFSNAGSFTAGDGIKLTGNTFNLDLNDDGLTSATDSVVSDDELAILDTSDSLKKTKTVTIQKLLTDTTDGSTLEVDSNSNSKIRIKDKGVTLAKIAEISRNKVLGYLSTNTDNSSSSDGVVEIAVDGSTVNNAEWSSNPDDSTLSTQLSIKKYVDSQVDGFEQIKSGEDDANIAETFNLTASSNIANLSLDYEDYIGKSIKINLSGNWPTTTDIIVVLPALAKTDGSNEFLVNVFLNMYKFFEINIKTAGITNLSDYSSFTSRKPNILFKANASCGFKVLSNYYDFGASNKANNYTEALIKTGNKILGLIAKSRPKISSSSGVYLYGTTTPESNQKISLRKVGGSILDGSDSDVYKFSIKQGLFYYNISGSVWGYIYYIDSYKI